MRPASSSAPYHGWSFDGEGHCTRIPQMQESCSPGGRRASCRTLPTASAQGLLFVWSGDPDAADLADLPLVPLLQEEGKGWADGWIVQDTFRDLPMDALTLLENVLDVSHVPFTHHQTVGRRENAAPVEAVISSESWRGFEALWEEGPRRGKLGSQLTQFRAPQLMWHDLDAKGLREFSPWFTPCPFVVVNAVFLPGFPFQFKSALPRVLIGLRPRWLQHIGNHKVLEDDQVFLHWQERVLEAAGGRRGSTCLLPANRFRPLCGGLASLGEYSRRRALCWTGSPCTSGGGELDGSLPQPHRALPQRSTALIWVRRLQPWCWGLLWISAVLVGLGQLGWLSFLGLGLALLALALVRRLKRWERGLTFGDGHAPRNHG